MKVGPFNLKNKYNKNYVRKKNRTITSVRLDIIKFDAQGILFDLVHVYNS